jgi:uncharacterized protein (TIGR00251 family)
MSDNGLRVHETGIGLVVRLHVQPRAKRSEVVGLHDGALKIRVTAPPVDDAANRAIIEFFSKLLGISRSNLQILAGGKSRDKTLQICGLTCAEFQSRISCHIP